MRVVIDTNVFVSGIFWKGPPAKLLEAWRDRQIEIVLTPAILSEYQRVGLELSRQFPQVELSPIIEAVAMRCHMIQDVALPKPACSDPDDDKFLAAAVAGNALFVISGDKSLLKVQKYGEIPIVTPAAFVKNHLPEMFR
jgi:putative PIN family toxin of toxin-antitoxin system